MKKEINKRALTRGNIAKYSLTSDMSDKEIEETMLKMNYFARKQNGFDISNHPYLKIKKDLK